MTDSIRTHKLRHLLFTLLKAEGIDDVLIQPYSRHEAPQSLESCSRLALTDAEKEYWSTTGSSSGSPA